MAGDYAWDQTKRGGQGEYFMGTTLTTTLFNKFKVASPYGNLRAEGSRKFCLLQVSSSPVMTIVQGRSARKARARWQLFVQQVRPM